MTSDRQANGSGPIARRMQLGAHLRRLRHAADITRDAAGWHIRGSESKISRMELGRVPLKERDVADLLTLYGVGDDDRASLLGLAKEANAPGWWQQYSDLVPPRFLGFLGLEDAACEQGRAGDGGRHEDHSAQRDEEAQEGGRPEPVGQAAVAPQRPLAIAKVESAPLERNAGELQREHPAGKEGAENDRRDVADARNELDQEHEEGDDDGTGREPSRVQHGPRHGSPERDVDLARHAAEVVLDLLGGRPTERTELRMVRERPLPFPPEPLASVGINLTRWSLDRADHREGRRNAFLRVLDAAGLGFDS